MTCDHQSDITIKEMTVTTNTNNMNSLATSETRELTDDELNAASGGIIVVCSSTGGGGAGKVTFNPSSIARETDASSPSLF